MLLLTLLSQRRSVIFVLLPRDAMVLLRCKCRGPVSASAFSNNLT